MARYFVTLRTPAKPGALFQPTWYGNTFEAPNAATARKLAKQDHERLRLTPTGDAEIDALQSRQPPASELEAVARISHAKN